MIDNTNLLRKMIESNMIQCLNSDVLYNDPLKLHKLNFDKIEGMLLGVAIGDALGSTSEGLSYDKRHKKMGEVVNYQKIGITTDDTQLTFRTLKQLILDDGLIPDNLAKRICKYHINGIGSTVRGFIVNYKDKNIPWYKAGINSTGNGALMRISPIIIPYLKNPHSSMYADAALDAMITHNSYANIACCVAFVNILWSLLMMERLPEKEWWINTYYNFASKIEKNSNYYQNHILYKETLSMLANRIVLSALQDNLSVVEFCNKYGAGASIFETVPVVIYILSKYANNPEQAIIRAVNDTEDNDTIASIVGAAIGALYGTSVFLDGWIERLDGSLGKDNNDSIFKLILMARNKFWN